MLKSYKTEIKKLEKQLKREQRCLSRKYEDLRKRNNKMKGEATRQNIQKQILKVQKLHHRSIHVETVSNVRENFPHLDMDMFVHILSSR